MGLFGGKHQDPSAPITFKSNGDIEYNLTSVATAKLALKQLRLRKRELAVSKRQVVEKERELRAQYTDKVRHRSPAMRGGGGVGKFVRSMQAGSRAQDRRHLADHLKPLEKERDRIDAMIAVVDRVVIAVESYILKHSS